jgi:SAM-dependent methyltransferase
MAHRLYGDLAWVWPVLSPVEDYRAEGKALLRLLVDQLGAGKKKERLTLLDLGCGAGHLHSYLTVRFDVTGVDLSAAMLRQAKGVNAVAGYAKGDLRSVRLGLFDAVMLHDAVSYMRSATDLEKALKSVKANLRPGGVGLVLPDYLQETFMPGEGAEAQGEVDGRSVRVLSRVEHGRKGRFELTLAFAIEDSKTGKRKLVEDRHECGLFSMMQWLGAAEKAGLDVRVVRRVKGKWVPAVASQGTLEPGGPPVGFVVG